MLALLLKLLVFILSLPFIVIGAVGIFAHGACIAGASYMTDFIAWLERKV